MTEYTVDLGGGHRYPDGVTVHHGTDVPDHPWPEHYSVATDRLGWLPGLYDTEATARHAATIDPAKLETLDHVLRADGQDRPATMADLAGLEHARGVS